MEKLLLGIDFGTSTNFVTRYDFSKKDAVAVENMGGYGGSNIFDNTIYIESSSNAVLGDLANKKGQSDPSNYFRDIKRYVSSDQWKQKIPHLDYRTYDAKEIASMIFAEIKSKVEKNENRKIDGVVLTVPYSYGDTYRRRIKEACEDAGMKVLQIIEEPVAAAVSFGIFDESSYRNNKEKVLVFDLGGGTLDITIFELSKSGDKTLIEVLNTDGVERLGGRDVDEILITKFRSMIGVEYNDIDDEVERKKYQEKLTGLARTTKENLSEDEEDDIYEGFEINAQAKELEFDLERVEFERWLKTNNIVGEIEDALDRCLMDVDGEDIEPEDIDRIILAGGSSSIPLIHETIERYFGKAPVSRKNLGELVGHGAGIIAGMTEDASLQFEIIRKVSKNVGIARGNRFEVVLPKNTRYGKFSDIFEIPIGTGSGDELKIHFYEGDSAIVEQCEKIGSITVDTSGITGSTLGISLSKDEKEGQLVCNIYDGNIIITNKKL